MSFINPEPPKSGPTIILAKPYGKQGKFKVKFMFHSKHLNKIITSDELEEYKRDNRFQVQIGYFK